MKKVAIIGFGSEGLAAYRYFTTQDADITIFDESETPNQHVPDGATFVSGPGCFDGEVLRDFDVVMRFPQVNPNRIHTNGEISSVIKEFIKMCPAPIIGVTGSKGKGTTSSLIHLMLLNADIKAHIAGNIGIPALDILSEVNKDDVVVLELSSFQLWDVEQSPPIAVVLMIEPEHLVDHGTLEAYLDAKANILRWQNTDDIVIHHPTNELTARIIAQGKGRKLPYMKAPQARVENDNFVIDEQIVCSTSQMKIPGKHNLENACAAITAAWQFTQNTEAITKALQTFSGLDHRLKLIRTVGGVKYYDDSIATTPGSAMAALNSFPEPKVIILGGSDKGADFTPLAEQMTQHLIRKAILIGQMKGAIAEKLEEVGFTNYEKLDDSYDMKKIVQHARHEAEEGDIVILSPACASFGMFKNYKDRGDQFVGAVKSL